MKEYEYQRLQGSSGLSQAAQSVPPTAIPIPPSSPPIVGALNDLNGDISVLESRLFDLQARLSMVLAPSAPTTASAGQVNVKAIVETPMTERINQTSAHVRSLVGCVDDILDRLHL